jgi:hypothetical protein
MDRSPEQLAAPVYVAVVGPGESATEEHRTDAARVGASLAEAGAVVLTGGLGGVMRAAAAGCRRAGGTSIGLLPDRDRDRANPESTFTIPTGMGELRNGLLVRAADAVVCVALSWGTLSEVALAIRTGKPVVFLAAWPLPMDGPIAADSPEDAASRALALAAARVAHDRSDPGPDPTRDRSDPVPEPTRDPI